jgi:hypothetical protein
MDSGEQAMQVPQGSIDIDLGDGVLQANHQGTKFRQLVPEYDIQKIRAGGQHVERGPKRIR